MTIIKSYADIEQSKKLAEILPFESADMCYEYIGKLNAEYRGTPINAYALDDDLPCWSLAALLNVIPGGQVNRMLNSDKWEASSWNDSDFEPAHYVEGYDNPIDACYEMIIKLHEQNLL